MSGLGRMGHRANMADLNKLRLFVLHSAQGATQCFFIARLPATQPRPETSVVNPKRTIGEQAPDCVRRVFQRHSALTHHAVRADHERVVD